MNNLKPLTLEDFKAAVDNIVADANDPSSELTLLLEEGRHYEVEAAKFDAEFARRIGLIVSSIDGLVKYAQSRMEEN